MASITLLIASTMLAATPAENTEGVSAAPQGTATTLYCLQVDPITGSNIGGIMCNTRDDWWTLGLDVDKEWAENGVAVYDGPIKRV